MLITGDGLPPAQRCLVCDREETPFVHDRNCPRLDCDLLPGASCDGSHESTLHDLRQAALRNPATPTAAVVGFADDPSALLRWALAAHRPALTGVRATRRGSHARRPGPTSPRTAVDDTLIRVWPATVTPRYGGTLAAPPTRTARASSPT
ncbi:hypothetical protein [Streptomyces sp. KL116D]|uniref:hypothetical protein n=1 Tax=Streptomyces sp. KL116D TaxID=3045152 RepID=UPI003558A615